MFLLILLNGKTIFKYAENNIIKIIIIQDINDIKKCHVTIKNTINKN